MVQSPGLLGSKSLSRPMAAQAGPDPLWHPLWSAALCIHPMGWPLGIARGSAQSGLVLSRQIQGLGRLPAAGEYGSTLIWGHVEYSLSARPALGSRDPAANKIDGTDHLFICALKIPRSGQNGHPFYG